MQMSYNVSDLYRQVKNKISQLIWTEFEPHTSGNKSITGINLSW